MKLFIDKFSFFELLHYCTHREIMCIGGQVLTGKDVVTEETAGRMINILRQLQQTLPASALASTWSTLKPEQQLAIQTMLSS